MKRWRLGTVLGVEVWFTQSSLLLSGLLWLLFSVTAAVWLKMPWGMAVMVGGTAVLLHWLGELVHQLGHAWVARRVGYPMRKLVSWLVLFGSSYPKDEPPLHATIHIRRALGGPAVSLAITLIAGLLLLILPASGAPDTGSPGTLLTGFVFWENLLVFFLGAFLPLGFTDGSTLLTWWPRRHDPQM